MSIPSYSITTDENQLVELTLKLPEAMVRDLARLAEENGRYINIETQLRLAHSLEKEFINRQIEKDKAPVFTWEPECSKSKAH